MLRQQSFADGEILACLERVKAAVSLGIHDLCLKTDAQQVVWAVHGDEFRLTLALFGFFGFFLTSIASNV